MTQQQSDALWNFIAGLLVGAVALAIIIYAFRSSATTNQQASLKLVAMAQQSGATVNELKLNDAGKFDDLRLTFPDERATIDFIHLLGKRRVITFTKKEERYSDDYELLAKPKLEYELYVGD